MASEHLTFYPLVSSSVKSNLRCYFVKHFLRPLVGCFVLATVAGIGFAEASEATRPKPSVIYVYDARPLNQLDLKRAENARSLWDTLHVLAALQGLANREHPQFYLLYCSGFGVETDAFWLDWLRNQDGWLGQAEVRKLGSVEEAIAAFRSRFAGLVVYDPAVPATSNLASTAAGCDNLLPVRYDATPGSMFLRLTQTLHLPVKLWLVQPDGATRFTGRGTLPELPLKSSGSAKADVYRWGIERYVKTGKCDPHYLAFYLDSFWLQHPTRCQADMHTLSNHDYFIARKSFFFDLSPWGDELPNDDPGQALGEDRRVFLELLRALHETTRGGLVKVGGFPPWPYKYTLQSQPPGKHDGVPTEWEFGRLISQFNGYMEADAAGLGAMANASFYQHYPLARSYLQPNAKSGLAAWRARGLVDGQDQLTPRLYVGHYVGDYDSPSWLYKAVPAFFRDSARGQVPLAWAFDPNLSDRCPQALAFAYRLASTNDFFVAGDSGAGYLNVRSLSVRPDSGLPSGLEPWVAHCRDYYQRWGMTITGFMLDGSGGAATEQEFQAYRAFSGDGIGTHFEKAAGLRAGIPTCPERDLPDSVAAAVEVIAQLASARPQTPGFLWARSILKSPGWYLQVAQQIRSKHPLLAVEFVDPYTFFGLIRLESQHGQSRSK